MNYKDFTKDQLISELEKHKHLAEAVDEKDRQILDLITQVKELNNLLNGSIKKEELKNYTETVEKERKLALDIANSYIQAFRDLLKQQKVNLDIAISYENLLSQKLNIKE